MKLIKKHQNGGISQPNTFIGRVTQVLGGSKSLQDKADNLSSVISFTPAGLVTGALDTGYDANHLVHNPNLSNFANTGLDILSMIPLFPKVRINLVKKAVDPLEYGYKQVAKKAGNILNKSLWGVKGLDAVADSHIDLSNNPALKSALENINNLKHKQ